MNREKDLEIGDELKNLKSFSMAMGSKDRGMAIGNSELIRESHNSFQREDPFTIEEDHSKDREKEDAFHFISYVPFNGTLYELDGLQAGPIAHGECGDETWLALAREQISMRIQKYAGSEIRFNLLAVVGDKKEMAIKEKQKLVKLRNVLYEALG